MRNGWDFAKLGELCGFQGGNQPPKSQFVNSPRSGYIRLLQIRDFKSDAKAVYIPESTKNRLCETDDIMIGRYGASVGQIHRGKAGAYNVALIKTIPDLQRVDREYFYLYLLSDCFQQPLATVAARSAQAGFSKADIAGFDVPLPPLPEQRRIVAILDEAFAGLATAVANTERNLASARELFESELNRVFCEGGEGWEEKRLGDLVELISGRHILAKDYNEDGNGVGYLTGPADFGDLHPTISKWTQKPQAFALRDDILITVKGAGVGKINILYDDKAAISRQLMAVRPKLAEARFVYRVLECRFDHFQASGAGATVPGLSREDILDLPLNLPSVEEQRFLVRLLDALQHNVDSLVRNGQKKIKELAELKQSLLEQAFAGKLTADGVEDDLATAGV